MDHLTNFNLRITKDMKKNIEQSAEHRGLTQNAVIVFALEHYFMQVNAGSIMNQFSQMVELAQDMDKKE